MAKSRLKQLEAFDPIPSEQREGWNEVVARSKKLVASMDECRWELILISEEIGTVYGEARLQRWANDIGIHYETARSYRKLAKRGFDRDFIAKWCATKKNPDGLTYSLVKAVGDWNMSLTNEDAVQDLEFLTDTTPTPSVRAYNAWRREIVAPPKEKEEKAKKVKASLQDRIYGDETVDDSVKELLYRIVESDEAIEQVNNLNLISDEMLHQLTVDAGRESAGADEDERETKAYSERIKRYRKAILADHSRIEFLISQGNLFSEELYDEFKYLRNLLNEILTVELPDLSHLEEHEASSGS